MKKTNFTITLTQYDGYTYTRRLYTDCNGSGMYVQNRTSGLEPYSDVIHLMQIGLIVDYMVG